MKIGIIGCGVVGGTLINWLKTNTAHELKLKDPAFKYDDDLSECEAIFISIPIESTMYGQDLSALMKVVVDAKKITKYVFIRSTVLPGTNDSFGTISMPEFLTERRAQDDFNNLKMVFGQLENNKDHIEYKNLLDKIFPLKEKIILKNFEAELAKYTHNCFGAFKVTFFNMIYALCKFKGVNFENVKHAANITGFLGSEHLQVPGHDGKKGFSGKCFPTNMESFEGYLRVISQSRKLDDFTDEAGLINLIRKLNLKYRGSKD
jgi:UDPglucose 6-dehydrogenase